MRVWNLETGRELAYFGGDAATQSIALTPDGRGIGGGDSLGDVYCLRYVDPSAL